MNNSRSCNYYLIIIRRTALKTVQVMMLGKRSHPHRDSSHTVSVWTTCQVQICMWDLHTLTVRYNSNMRRNDLHCCLKGLFPLENQSQTISNFFEK